MTVKLGDDFTWFHRGIPWQALKQTTMPPL